MTPELEKVCEETAEKFALKYFTEAADENGLEYAKGRSSYQILESDFKECFKAALKYQEERVQELVEALEYYASGVFFKIKTGQGLQPDLTKAKQALEKFRGEE